MNCFLSLSVKMQTFHFPSSKKNELELREFLLHNIEGKQDFSPKQRLFPIQCKQTRDASTTFRLRGMH